MQAACWVPGVKSRPKRKKEKGKSPLNSPLSTVVEEDRDQMNKNNICNFGLEERSREKNKVKMTGNGGGAACSVDSGKSY